MKKFALALAAAFALTTAAQAGEMLFVSYDKEKKELKLKADKDAEAKTYTVSTKTTYKNGDKELKADKVAARFEALKDGDKLDVTVEKDAVKEVKFPAKKKTTDK